MINLAKNLIDKLFHSKDVVDSLKQLREYQENRILARNKEKELIKIVETINKYPKLFEMEGFGYLTKFADYYLKNYQSIDSRDLMSKIVAQSIIASSSETLLDPFTVSQEIIKNIATTKFKSISKNKSSKAFIISQNISLIMNSDITNIVRLKQETKKLLGTSDKIKKFVMTIAEKYSPLLGVLGKSKSLSTLEHDMTVIIGHGSQQLDGQKNQAERYLEFQKFEQEVKSEIKKYVDNGDISSSKTQEYLMNNAIRAAKYLQEDYSTGLDRNLSVDEINKRLATIEKIINLIKKGEATTIMSPQIITQVKYIADSIPSLSTKQKPPEYEDDDDDF